MKPTPSGMGKVWAIRETGIILNTLLDKSTVNNYLYISYITTRGFRLILSLAYHYIFIFTVSMDGISAAASILGIATAGIQISIKLITFSNQVGTAPSRIRNIGNDVSLTSGVLQQLGDLMKAKISDDDDKTSIFSPSGLESTKASAEACNGIFHDLKHALERASKQIRTNSENLGGKVVLSTVERLKWPFLQPGFDDLRADLRESRETLMLILQVTTLAYSKKLAEL